MIGVALSACVLGLALCPVAYILIGALSGFGPAFAFLSIPLLVLSIGFLLFRLLASPQAAGTRPLLLVMEAVCWVLIAAFLVIVSGFTLVTRFERVGLTCVLLLATTLVSVPVVLLRSTELRRRLTAVPAVWAGPLLGAFVVSTLAIAVAYLLRKPSFL